MVDILYEVPIDPEGVPWFELEEKMSVEIFADDPEILVDSLVVSDTIMEVLSADPVSPVDTDGLVMELFDVGNLLYGSVVELLEGLIKMVSAVKSEFLSIEPVEDIIVEALSSVAVISVKLLVDDLISVEKSDVDPESVILVEGSKVEVLAIDFGNLVEFVVDSVERIYEELFDADPDVLGTTNVELLVKLKVELLSVDTDNFVVTAIVARELLAITPDEFLIVLSVE